MIFEQVTILGVGLIGGSLGGALRKNRIAERVMGWGRTEANLKFAVNKGFIDRYFMKASEAIKGSEVVIICVHPQLYPEIFSLLKWEGFAGIVSEVGSVKKRVITHAQEYNYFNGMFVPTHPVAGKEKGSVKHADPELFAGERCILTPYEGINREAMDKIKSMWRGIGSDVIEMDAETHDRILALVSHLPHITAYLTYMLAKEKGYEKYGGGSFRDSTRVAGSPVEMWAQIFLWNREEVLKAVDEFESALQEFKSFLRDESEEKLISFLRRGKKNEDTR